MKAARLIAILLAGALLIYVLSIGPAYQRLIDAPAPNKVVLGERSNRFATVYYPILWLSGQRLDGGLLKWYLKLWSKPHGDVSGAS